MNESYDNIEEIKSIGTTVFDLMKNREKSEGSDSLNFISAEERVNADLKKGWVLLKIKDNEYILGKKKEDK